MAVEKLWSQNKYKFHNLLLNFTHEMYSVPQRTLYYLPVQCALIIFISPQMPLMCLEQPVIHKGKTSLSFNNSFIFDPLRCFLSACE